jgi:phosphate transport system substrate-binding protein
VKWNGGIAEQGNPGVAGYVSRTEGALGYIELTYALREKLRMGLLQNKEGFFVRPSLESVTAAAEAGTKDLKDELTFNINNMPGKESYPICGASWAVFYVKQPADKKKALVNFLTWAVHDGQKECEEEKYPRLPKGLVEKIDTKLKEVKGEK